MPSRPRREDGRRSRVVNGPLLAVLALGVEALAGYPAPLFRRIGHPVTWMGGWLHRLEHGLNGAATPFATRKAAGVLALAMLLGGVGTVAGLLAGALSGTTVGGAALLLLAASLPAQRSLHEHVAAVATALETGGLAAGRQSVSRIVGRDPEALDAAGVARAAIESLAENFADGVVAPAFWTAALGLPGGALYKAANTADSMVGHRTPRLAAFGWAAARFDDLVNLPASRLAALWLVGATRVVGGDWRAAVAAIRRDARHHRSPNAGWPEAAMAGALGLALAGPRVYGGVAVDEVTMGQGRRDATPADIHAALRLFRVACAVQGAVLATLAGLLWAL